MGYQRAQWHSGLTYCQICETCKTEVRYTDYSLDFRPWYPDGYVDCPNCKSHLRHNEKYAGNTAAEVVAQNTENPTALFCTSCGKKFGESDRFCSMCGAKRG